MKLFQYVLLCCLVFHLVENKGHKNSLMRNMIIYGFNGDHKVLRTVYGYALKENKKPKDGVLTYEELWSFVKKYLVPFGINMKLYKRYIVVADKNYDRMIGLKELIWAVDGINKQLGIKKGPQVYTGKRYG